MRKLAIGVTDTCEEGKREKVGYRDALASENNFLLALCAGLRVRLKL